MTAEAMLEVDRAKFVAEGNPYDDKALPIGSSFNSSVCVIVCVWW